MVGVALVILGFNEGESDWGAPITIAALAVGVGLLVVGAVNECATCCSALYADCRIRLYTKRTPIIAPRLFKTRTTTILLLSVIFHAIGFFSGACRCLSPSSRRLMSVRFSAVLLPGRVRSEPPIDANYNAVLGSSPIMAGVRTMPYSVGAAVVSVAGGYIISYTGRYKEIMVASFAIFTLGQGLMILLDSRSSIAEQVMTTLVASIGIGSRSCT
jgi:hypothetical protein